MKRSPEFRADRLAWRFGKSGRDGVRCKQFTNHDKDVQKRLRAAANIREGEVPALASFVDEQKWVLVTDRRVVWKTGPASVLQELPLAEIADATVQGSALLTAGTKSAVTELTLVSRNGDRHHLELESGQPFSGFWNALKMAATWE